MRNKVCTDQHEQQPTQFLTFCLFNLEVAGGTVVYWIRTGLKIKTGGSRKRKIIFKNPLRD